MALGNKFPGTGVDPKAAYADYLHLLTSTFKLSVLLDKKLKDQTKGHLESDWDSYGKVTLDNTDADDLNLAEEILGALPSGRK